MPQIGQTRKNLEIVDLLSGMSKPDLIIYALHMHDKAETMEKQRDAAFAMSRCECGVAEACRNLVEKDMKITELEEKLKGDVC